MENVSARELRDRLGHYLRAVRQGRIVVITWRGRPVARLVPISVLDAPLQLFADLHGCESDIKIPCLEHSRRPAAAKFDSTVVSKMSSGIGCVLKQLVNCARTEVNLCAALGQDILHLLVRHAHHLRCLA